MRADVAVDQCLFRVRFVQCQPLMGPFIRILGEGPAVRARSCAEPPFQWDPFVERLFKRYGVFSAFGPHPGYREPEVDVQVHEVRADVFSVVVDGSEHWHSPGYIPVCGFAEFRRCRVSGLQSFGFAEFRVCRVSALQSFGFAEFRVCRVSGLQSSGVELVWSEAAPGGGECRFTVTFWIVARMGESASKG